MCPGVPLRGFLRLENFRELGRMFGTPEDLTQPLKPRVGLFLAVEWDS